MHADMQAGKPTSSEHKQELDKPTSSEHPFG